MTPIEKIVDYASQWVGYLEKSKTEYHKDPSIVYEMTAGAGRDNYTMTWEDTRPTFQGQAWCMNFVYWLFFKCFGIDAARKILYLDTWYSNDSWNNFACFSWAENFEAHGARYQSSAAQVGDLIFFTKSHVGIVTDIKDGRVFTIEGNTSNASGVISNGGGVARKSYVLGISDIYCYGRPDYSLAPKDNGKPIIGKGYKDSVNGGHFCADLQEALNTLGIVDDSGNALDVDGSCGDKTTQAIIRFQGASAAEGIYSGEIDGICGNMTWAAVEKAVENLHLLFKVARDIIIKNGAECIVDSHKDGYAHLRDFDIYIPDSFLEPIPV